VRRFGAGERHSVAHWPHQASVPTAGFQDYMVA
jgi:hypothetical protein